MKTNEIDFRNQMLIQAAQVLTEAGRDRSAKVIRHHLRPDMRVKSNGDVQTRFLLPTAGYQVAERLHFRPMVPFWTHNLIGIVSHETARLLRHCLIDVDLPYDGYDRVLSESAARFLIIEVDALALKFGWQHALTLRDPAATAELAAMVLKARSIGIVTTLIKPRQIYRFPLLSRVIDAFDHVADDPAGIMEIRAA